MNTCERCGRSLASAAGLKKHYARKRPCVPPAGAQITCYKIGQLLSIRTVNQQNDGHNRLNIYVDIADNNISINYVEVFTESSIEPFDDLIDDIIDDLTDDATNDATSVVAKPSIPPVATTRIELSVADTAATADLKYMYYILTKNLATIQKTCLKGRSKKKVFDVQKFAEICFNIPALDVQTAIVKKLDAMEEEARDLERRALVIRETMFTNFDLTKK
jgi:hypothetical protein